MEISKSGAGLTFSLGGGGEERITRDQKGASLLSLPEDYTLLDLETTGLYPGCDEIIEFAALKIRNNEIVDSFSTLIKPQNEISDFIAGLTGITNDMVKDAPEISKVISKIKEYISDDIIVGHNVNFDINFLYDTFLYNDLPPLSNDFVDTLRFSRRLYPEWRHHRLGDLVENLLPRKYTAHRALDDCKSTFECFNVMRDAIILKYGSVEEYIKSIKKHDSFRLSLITATTTEIDESNPFFGKVCVFTGTLSRMVRSKAAQFVVNLGGICADTVTAKTNYLILGNNDYCKAIKDGKSSKHKRAEQLMLSGADIRILPEDVFYDMLDLEHCESLCNKEKNAIKKESRISSLLSKQVESPDSDIKIEYNKDGSISYFLYGFGPVLKVYFHVSTPYILFNTVYIADDKIFILDSFKWESKYCDNNSHPKKEKIRIYNIPSYSDELLSELFGIVAAQCYSCIKTDFDICALYERCSDAGKCIKEDESFGRRCSYRKKLEQGMIFYGKNRNVEGAYPNIKIIDGREGNK